jgi:hypothetical protein
MIKSNGVSSQSNPTAHIPEGGKPSEDLIESSRSESRRVLTENFGRLNLPNNSEVLPP